MNNAILMLWLIALGVSVIAIFDWLGRRKERQSKQRSRT
jgi:hypothetical protein